MYNKPKTVAQWLFIVSVSILSLMHIGSVLLFNHKYISLLNSLVGLSGVVLFLFNKKQYVFCMYVWSIAQILTINWITFVTPTRHHYIITSEKSIWSFEQFFDLCWYVSFGNVQLCFNFLSVAYVTLAIRLAMDSIYGQELSIKPLKGNATLTSYLPSTAIIEKRVKVDQAKNWYVVKLLPSSTLVIIRPKDDYLLKKGKRQVVSLLIPVDPVWVANAVNLTMKEFKKGGWAVID